MTNLYLVLYLLLLASSLRPNIQSCELCRSSSKYELSPNIYNTSTLLQPFTTKEIKPVYDHFWLYIV